MCRLHTTVDWYSMQCTEHGPFVQVDELRGSPMSVGSLEEIIDEK